MHTSLITWQIITHGLSIPLLRILAVATVWTFLIDWQVHGRVAIVAQCLAVTFPISIHLTSPHLADLLGLVVTEDWHGIGLVHGAYALDLGARVDLVLPLGGHSNTYAQAGISSVSLRYVLGAGCACTLGCEVFNLSLPQV
jgi:hypothetical protein